MTRARQARTASLEAFKALKEARTLVWEILQAKEIFETKVFDPASGAWWHMEAPLPADLPVAI